MEIIKIIERRAKVPFLLVNYIIFLVKKKQNGGQIGETFQTGSKGC